MTPEERKEMRRLYSRRYYWKKKAQKDSLPPYNYMEYEYKVVPNSWRNDVRVRDTYVRPVIESPLIKDLLAGKTLFVDYQMSVGETKNHPFRTLYSFFAARGFKLRIHVYDDVKSNKYRRLLMWIEPIKPVLVKNGEAA